MAIGTPYASAAQWYGNTNSTSETITPSANVNEGDLIVVMTYMDPFNILPVPNSSITGFTHIGQFEPSVNGRGIVDVLAKYVTAGEDGTSPTYTVNFGYASIFGKIMMVTVVPGADISGITLDFTEYSSSTSVTFPVDSQDLTIHLLGNNQNNIDLDTDFPAGDTDITWPSTGSWRQAGFAISGGTTASGTFPSSVNGTFGTIHISETAGGGGGGPATFSGWESVRYAGLATNRDHALAATPNAGDEIIVTIWRGNGATTGAQNPATSTGFSEVTHNDPATTFKMIGTVLQKTADGTEGTINFDWVANDGNSNQVITSVIVAGADPSSVVATLTDGSGTVWNYAADTLDHSIHTGATDSNNDTSSTLYPSGDTNTTHSAIGFRNGGISLSGGNTASGTHSASLNGGWGTISLSDAVANGPITDVSNIAENEVLDPASSLSFDLDITGPAVDVDTAYLELIRLSDGFFWSSSSVAWQVGQISTVQGIATGTPPLSRTITFPNDPPTLTEGVNYQLNAIAQDINNLQGPTHTRLFSVGTYEYAPDITFTALNGNDPPTGIVTSPTQNQRLANSNAAGFTILGTADDTDGIVSTVEVSINSGAYAAATNTGTNFSTWSFVTGVLAIGGHTIDVRITDDDSAQTILAPNRDFIINALPSVIVTTPLDGFRFFSNSTSIALVGTAADDDSVTAVEVQWQINGAGFNAYVTATGTAAWNHTIPSLVQGDAIDVNVRSLDADGEYSITALRSYAINEFSTIGSLSGISDNDELPDGSTFPDVTFNNVQDDFGNITRYHYRLFRTSILGPSGWWDQTIPGWAAPVVLNASSVSDDSTPASYTFADGVDGTVLPVISEGHNYVYGATTRDADFEVAPLLQVSFSSPWLPPETTITAPTNNQRDPAATTSIAMTGTAVHTGLNINLVEVSMNGGSSWVNATIDTGAGTPSATWSHAFTGQMSATFDLRARATDSDSVLGPEDSISYSINDLPMVTGLTPSSDVLANAPMSDVVISGTDDINVDRGRFSLQRDSDSNFWNLSTTSWQASSVDNELGITPASPATVTFNSDLPADLGINIEYTLIAALRDQTDAEWSADTTNVFSSLPLIPVVDLTQVTGNHNHTDLLTGTSTAQGGATITTVELRVDGGAYITATNTGTNFSTWEIDPLTIPGWPISHQLDGSNNPITMPDVLVEARATDDTPDFSSLDSATLTPILPAPTVAIGNRRAISGTVSDASIIELRIERDFTNGGVVDQMWNGTSWIADDASWLIISTTPTDIVWSYTPPVWLESDDATTDKDDYVVSIRARSQTGTVSDSVTLDTDWPVVTYQSPADLFEYSTDPGTVNVQMTATDANTISAQVDVQIRREISDGVSGPFEYLNSDLSSWSSSPQVLSVSHTSGVVTVLVPTNSGYTYRWGLA